MSTADNWTAVLKCGHEFRTGHEAKPGDWITCIVLKCQGQRRVERVVPVSSVPAPGETGVQGTLWEAEAA